MSKLVVTRACPHNDTIGLFPSSTGGTERCYTCGAERTQYSLNGPWRPWRDPVEFEVDEMFCTAATHGPRNSTCTCERD